MVNTIFILDKAYNTSQILVGNKNAQRTFWNDTYTQEFDTGAESFEFSCYLSEEIVEGNYVVFYYNNQYKMFTIMDIEQEHKEGRLVANCYCEVASLALLNNFVRPFDGDMNCIQFFQHILEGTGWQIGNYNTSLRDNIQTINVSKLQSVWSLIEDYKDIYECEINVRVTYENNHITGQFIDIYSEGGLGTPTFKRFEYGKNVTGIVKKKELYDWCTAIILDVECEVSDTIIKASDGYGFTKEAGDVILNPKANETYNNGKSYVVGVYSGNEEEPVEACINAWKELEKRSEPRFDYEVTTALTVEEYDNIHLGDTVYVVDYSYTPALLLEARVGKLELSFTDRTQNKCTLTNYKEIKSKLLDADKIKLQSTVTNIVDTFFPVTSDGIADGAIVDGKIDTVYYKEITADIVSAGVGAFEDLYSRNMTVINADIANLRAEKADITQLNATNANIGNLQADVADINTLINGHLTSDNIQSLILTSDKVTVADAFIKNAMIDTVSASKINTGTINTNNVQIQSADGSMIINGTTQQFKDKNGKVRIQIGKDAQGNFTFSLFDANGTGVLINQDGIKSGAVADGLIVNKMVADNANISGGKLDIASVVTSINNGSTTLKGSKIKLDEANQTLDVAFNSLTTTVTNMDIGEKNVILNSSFNDGTAKWTKGNGNVTIVTGGVDGGKCFRSSGTLTGTTRYYQEIKNLEWGKEYTISYYYKGDNIVHGSTNPYIRLNLAYYNGGTYVSETSIGSVLVKGTTGWTKVTKTVTLPTGINVATLSIYARDFTGYAYFDHIKMVRGNKSTDWTPAPADVGDKVTSNTTSITAQQGQINTLISDTTITKDGSSVKLKDAYNSTVATVSSLTTKIGSVESTANGVSDKQTALEADLGGFKTTV